MLASHHARPSALLLTGLVLLAALGGCSRDRSLGTGGGAVGTGTESAPKNEFKANDKAAAGEAEETPPSTSASPAAPPEPPPSLVAGNTKWKLGELQDIAPAGPATATPQGIVLATKDNEIVLAALRNSGRFQELELGATEFAKYGRGPSVVGENAYWIGSDSRLHRQKGFSSEKSEVLVEGAQPGTRTSAIRVGDRDLVAFVGKQGDQPIAMLWVEGQEPHILSPDGSTATSVILVPNGTTPLALTLAGRTGMSPVHARRIRVAKRRVNLDPDRVVWVGPGSHALSELTAVNVAKGQTMGFLATAKNITEFGLAHFLLPSNPTEVEQVKWRPYPNGIDPAPVVAEAACGKRYVFYAVPSSTKPRAPQQLQAAPLDGDRMGQPEVLANSRAFNDISVAPTKQGAVISWTADRRTWATTLGCPAP